MVEQNVNLALKICHHAFVMKTGHIVMSGTGAELLSNDEIRVAYLGRRGGQKQ